MGGGFIGGDGSVKWQFHGESIRGGSIISNGEGIKGHRQEAIDETDPGASFVLTMDLPIDEGARKKFVTDLIEQLKSGRTPISITLPIEDAAHGGPNHDQIRIEWPSRRQKRPVKNDAADR
jgi:hypothetical protein